MTTLTSVTVDASAGIKALHARLLHEMRDWTRQASSARLYATASALSLMLFGHAAHIEGAVVDAARKAVGEATADTSAEQLAELFLAALPVQMFDVKVRDAFFAAHYEAVAEE